MHRHLLGLCTLLMIFCTPTVDGSLSLSISPYVTETFWELLKLFRCVLDWHNNGSGDMAVRLRKIVILSRSYLVQANRCSRQLIALMFYDFTEDFTSYFSL